MMNEELKNEGILKEEKVGYLKSALNLLQGTLYMTPKRVVLDAHEAGVGGLGILGAILKKKVEEKSYGFNLEYKEVGKISQGKHGVEKNVLEISDKQNNTYRIIVKNFSEWENELKSKL